jgi:hypothetical protein
MPMSLFPQIAKQKQLLMHKLKLKTRELAKGS